MRILVVFESMFGATEEVAKAIGKGLAGAASPEVVNVDEAPRDLTGVGLLVVGGPTHVHGMSRRATRKSAADQVDYPTRSRTGVREWLDSLDEVPAKLAAAAFDTRIDKPRVFTGAASLGVAKRLRRHGCRLVLPAESFFVGTESIDAGPEPGEPERAEAWGAALGAALVRAGS
ncbi:Flavodoxin [Amycolatopsis tolypomycina]|uniref:Flavodoxin n=1 Tax=Amycolatopsis tolypomycina TaxID=208445 RepID=A0A1H4U7B8_9PSEU|nr:flavodoxin domain-containing protein [Amycolatopsis tolypomycina]SEC64131.1 Flavodoxin [Amycolatopsis tolypomycina]